MIDAPQVPPPVYAQVLTEEPARCGLHADGFTVKYEQELQSVEIVIDRKAAASVTQLECIRQAAEHAIVTFQDAVLQSAYDDRVAQAVRPRMLAETRAELEKRGILDDFPERSRFASDKLFAEALERQCKWQTGSFFVEYRGGLTIRPELLTSRARDDLAMSCMMAAILYVSAKGETFGLSFIGNEAAPSER